MRNEVKIDELWVYPVKACQGVSLQSAMITPTGIEYDRTWCIVDLDGTHVPKLEAISGRRLPILASIQVRFNDDAAKKESLSLNAPGMDELRLPTSPQGYAEGATLRVQSAGTTAGGSWSLGFLECKQHTEGSAWITQYLNTPKAGEEGKENPRLINGKTTKGNFALVRSMNDWIDLGEYPPIFPLIEKSKTDLEYKQRFQGNYRRLSDFAPFLLVSKASARDLSSKAGVEKYPSGSMRGNIIVDGDKLKPWAEETWSKLAIIDRKSGATSLKLHTIKQCPRCTVPCRDQTTGQFLYKEKLLLWKTLKAAFPRKYSDPEWGSWAGAYMGVYMGHNAAEGTEIQVGDVIETVKIVPWDAHLKSSSTKMLWNIMLCSAGVVAGIALMRRSVRT